jgi:soluble lytic murein transglycosylase-like protein
MLPDFLRGPRGSGSTASPASEIAPRPLNATEVRDLLLTGQAGAAWNELRLLTPAPGSEEAYLQAWAASESGAPEAARLLLPFTTPRVPLDCRAPATRAAARALAAEGRIVEADGLLQDLRAALPELTDHVLLWSIEARVPVGAEPVRAGTAGRLLREADSLHHELTLLRPLPALLRKGERARGRLLARAGRLQDARALLVPLLPRIARRDRPDLLMEIAELDLELGDALSAESRMRQIVIGHPESRGALELLEPGPGSIAFDLTLSARERALILAAHGRLQEAVDALSSVSDPALLRLRGDIQLRGENFLAAAADYAEAVARGGPREALELELAKAYARGSDPARARAIYQTLVAQEPADPTLLFLLADALQEESALAPALADSAAFWFERLISTHPRTSRAQRALLRLAHLRFARGDWEEAEELYARYIRTYPSGEDRREARYWRALAVYESGSRGRARELLRELLRGGEADYYALLARRRLGAKLGRSEAGLFEMAAADSVGDRSAKRWRFPETPSDTILPYGGAGAGALARARALLVLGEVQDAQREVDEALRQAGRSRQELRQVARWALAWGFPESAYRIGAAFAPTAGAEHPDAGLAFPPAFAEHVLFEGRENDVSPGLLLAIMRQESKFDPAARSPVGAMGLLQLMPGTARREAETAALPSFDVEDLERPEANLHLGAQHLRGLLDAMEGEWPAAIASYNAGRSQAERWRHFPEAVTLEAYVERIPFRETRMYVKQVITNYVQYAELYASD